VRFDGREVVLPTVFHILINPTLYHISPCARLIQTFCMIPGNTLPLECGTKQTKGERSWLESRERGAFKPWYVNYAPVERKPKKKSSLQIEVLASSCPPRGPAQIARLRRQLLVPRISKCSLVCTRVVVWEMPTRARRVGCCVGGTW